MDISKISRAHFVGIGGIGVSAALRYFSKLGISISGSDVILPSTQTLPEGKYHEGHKEENITEDIDLLVYSPAVPSTNPERKRARELGIIELSYPEVLQLITSQYNTIAVSGTHGKSTTTALLGRLFEEGEYHPNVIVGAEVPGWKDRNLLKGESDVFIVEACEYRRHMLTLNPQAILLTNLELDHPDYYRDIEDIKDAFLEYIQKLDAANLLIINNDDANIRSISANSDAIIVTYGIGESADLIARNIEQNKSSQVFDLMWKGTSIGRFTTKLPGLYNIYNILAATATYLAYGGKSEIIQKVLTSFIGVGRRYEQIGTLGETKIISDYAHHPTALKAVNQAINTQYDEGEVLVVFRPHHRERTRKLFDDFVKVFEGIRHLVLIEIYDVAGREDASPISSQDLLNAVLKQNPDADIIFAEDLKEAEEIIRREAHQFQAILIVGAGDADNLAHNLLK